MAIAPTWIWADNWAIGPPFMRHSVARSKSNSKMQKIQRSVLVEPDQGQRARLRSQLQPFEPLDLREIVEDAKVSPGFTPEKIRATETAAQIQQILTVLRFPVNKPPNWSRAFYALAEVLLDVGHVQYTPSRQNRAAATWDKADIAFLAMVHRLTQGGLSERRAIDKIAADPKKWGRLPYKQNGRPLYGGKIEQAKRAAALRRHLNRIKQRWGKNPLECVFGLQEWPTSPLHRKFLDLELGPLAGALGGDKRNG